MHGCCSLLERRKETAKRVSSKTKKGKKERRINRCVLKLVNLNLSDEDQEGLDGTYRSRGCLYY